MRALARNTPQLQLLRESLALLKPNLDEFSNRSIERFFDVLPVNLNDLSPNDFLGFHRDLIRVFESAIQHADRPERLTSLIMPMVSCHLKENAIRPVHLAILVNCLMTTGGEILQSDWTAEVEDAWDEALHTLLLLMLKIACTAAEQPRVESNR